MESMKKKIIFPNEILVKIFCHLTYDDLMVVRKADEVLEETIDYVVSLRVVWCQNEYEFRAYTMFHTNEFLDTENCFISRSLQSFVSSEESRMNIKKLILPVSFLDANFSSWNNLIHLEIMRDCEDSYDKKSIVVNAVNLQILRIGFCSHSFGCLKVIFNTPSLKYLKSNCSYTHSCVLSFPETIIHLNCKIIPKQIKEFTNLRQLFCYEYSGEKDLLDLHKLEKFSSQRIDKERRNEAKCLLDTLHRNRVKVTFGGILYEPNLFTFFDLIIINYQEFQDNSLRVYERFLDRIEDDLSHEWLKISNLDDLSLKLIQKLTNLYYVDVVEPFFNETNWIEILKIRRLKEIKFFETPVDQKFLDIIPVYAPNIIELDLNENFRGMNLKFVTKLKRLESITCYCLFDFETFKCIIQNRTNLKLIFIHERPTNIEIMIRHEKITIYWTKLKAKRCELSESLSTFRNKIDLLDDWTELYESMRNIPTGW